MKKLQIHTRVRRLFHYLEDFEKGIIRIPAFQRDFVWDNAKKIELFDSISKGYPIGSILFWRPEVASEYNSEEYEATIIGSYSLAERGNDYFYILDGFQRLSTLFGCLMNPEKTNLKRDNAIWNEQFNIVYNLEEGIFEHNKRPEFHRIPLYKLVDGRAFFEFQKQLVKLETDKTIDAQKAKSYLNKYEEVSTTIIEYVIPSTDMIGGTFNEAIELFSRVNSAGSQITDEWVLKAKKRYK